MHRLAGQGLHVHNPGNSRASIAPRVAAPSIHHRPQARRVCASHVKHTATRASSLVTRAILLTPSQRTSDAVQRSLPGTELPNDALVATQFSWTGAGEVVELWGSWNNWEAPVRMHCPEPGQAHRAIIPMPHGGVEYKYKVDGQWRISRQELTVANAQGQLNNFRIVHPTLKFSVSAPNSQQVSVIGDWDLWQYSIPLTKDHSTGLWEGSTHLRPGEFCYQYLQDNRLVHNAAEEAGLYPGRGIVNMAWSVEQPLFRIFYCTGWDEVVLCYRRILPDGSRATKDFQKMRMVSASSRGNELGQWYFGVVVPLEEGESMEFYLTNGKTGSEVKEDKPTSSKSNGTSSANGLYILPRAGSFKLSWGQIRPFPRGGEPRYMLVSDIDGTMIGEHGDPSQYASSKRFRDYWESGPALGGSILVYNTGRSLGQVKEMLKNVPEVAHPDALIAAVGTKVFTNMQEVGRAHATGQSWVEDLEWTRQLDQGWNLGVVRKLGRRLLDQYGSSGQLSVLDDGSEHQHRFSFSADLGILDHVTRSMLEGATREGLDVRVIVSGNGSHRYVDCVPMAAGKEKALQYLRVKYGIPEHYCVAAGDSGNDILMLEGDHPSIVVGNAQNELLSWLVKQPQDGKVLLADAFYADGIMEGLARHGLF